MDKFVIKCNLPLDAELVLIGEKYLPLLQKPLENLCVEVLAVPDNKCVDVRLSSHADLSVFHGGGEHLFLANCLQDTDFAENLSKIGCKLNFCAVNQAKKYPFDAFLNICGIGNSFIYSPKVSDEVVISFLAGQGRSAIACKQGYCRCSVCVVDEKAIICADKGINAACRNRGFDVLEIQPGFVELSGFEYGFIGGAAFKLGADKLAFTGTLDYHPNKWEILDFLKKHQVSPIFLTNAPIFDIGSAVSITEKQRKN